MVTYIDFKNVVDIAKKNNPHLTMLSCAFIALSAYYTLGVNTTNYYNIFKKQLR